MWHSRHGLHREHPPGGTDNPTEPLKHLPGQFATTAIGHAEGLGLGFFDIERQANGHRDQRIGPGRKPNQHLADDEVQPPERAILLAGRSGAIAVGRGPVNGASGLLRGGRVKTHPYRFALRYVMLGQGDHRDPEPIESVVERPAEEDVEGCEVLVGAGSSTPEVVRHRVATRREHEAECQEQKGLLGGFGKEVHEVALEERAEARAIERVHGVFSVVWLVENNHLTKEGVPWFRLGHRWPHFSLN